MTETETVAVAVAVRSRVPWKIISTDFDGTIHEEFTDEPVPHALQARLAVLQSAGVVWVINTGRDLASLMEAMGRARMKVRPDFVVAVEREIHRWEQGRYIPMEPWNTKCHLDHAEVFGDMAPVLDELLKSLANRYDATFYEDIWSPLCVIARTNAQMDAIQSELEVFCRQAKDLVSVRNDVYVRLSHRAYSKGTALQEIARRLKVAPAQILAAGDHLNDLPMLRREIAGSLVAPFNSVPEVKSQVLLEGGVVRPESAGKAILAVLDRPELAKT